MGGQLAPTSARGVMMVYKTLRKGGVTGILPDQEPDDENSAQYVEFFGQPAYTMTLIHNLAQKSGCRLIMTTAIRVKGGFELHFFEPDADIYTDDTAVALRAMNKSIEHTVAMAPNQYQWDYKRFKTQPDPTVRHYKKL